MGVYSGKVSGGKLTGRQSVTGGRLNVRGQLRGGALQTPEHFGVSSVNGMTGDVVLTPEDIGAVSEQDWLDHINNRVVHITADERATWNECLIGAVNAEESLTFWKAGDVI